MEQRAVEAVLIAEEALGHLARDMNDEQRNHAGYDIQSIVPTRGDDPDRLLFIEVKGRIEGCESVTVSPNEMLTALSAPDQFVLALVEVGQAGGCCRSQSLTVTRGWPATSVVSSPR